MLSYLDCVIFPDRCEVYEVVPSQRYIYPIFKNGTSSLLAQSALSKWKIKFNEQIRKLESIDVILRDPTSRLVSGINTFVQHTIRDNPTLDANTVLWFAKNYLYLNRHYTSQFSWIVNLSRYINPEAKLNFLPMLSLSEFTTLDEKPENVNSVNTEFIKSLGEIPNGEMYQRLDNALVDSCLNQSLTFAEVVAKVKSVDIVSYDFVVTRAQKILKPIYALPTT